MTLKLAIFTEDEARGQLCPQKLVHPGRPASTNGCDGPRCMAWRWFLTNTNKAPGEPLEPDGETYGFCGLAGVPDASIRR